MIAAPLPENERERLRALARYAVLDTPPEEAFDDLVALAGEICGAPIALVSLVDAHRQWFKARVGLDAPETPRELAFCAHAILEDAILEVPNALEDPRFADNPLVTGAPDIRFYAGQPLITNDGYRLGTLCVIDRVPRRLDDAQLRALRTLGRQIIDLLELRATTSKLARRVLEIESLRRSESRVDDPAWVDGGVAQRAFLARVTHDLRTPLNAIVGFAELLTEDAVDDLERRESAGRIVDAGRYMGRLVDDILDLAHLDSGRLRFTDAPIDVDALAAAVLETVRPLAHAAGDQVTLRGGRPGRTLRGDALRIRQVLLNLLSNACKYTQDGAITLTIADVDDRWVRLEVTDTGIGMRDEQRRQLFRPFAQVQEAARQSREGTGLGLHITRALCERMGGAIAVESAPGVGTTFTVWLPLEPTAAPRGTAVVVVDGEPKVRAAIQRAIGGVTPIVYFDGVAEALWAAAERPWRAIVIDLSAPEAHEIELLRAVARVAGETSTRLVLVADADAAAPSLTGAMLWRSEDDPRGLIEAVAGPLV